MHDIDWLDEVLEKLSMSSAADGKEKLDLLYDVVRQRLERERAAIAEHARPYLLPK